VAVVNVLIQRFELMPHLQRTHEKGIYTKAICSSPKMIGLSASSCPFDLPCASNHDHIFIRLGRSAVRHGKNF
jgi:hypothetical protein